MNKPSEHLLRRALEAQVRLLATTLQPGTMHGYRLTVRLFLDFLEQRFPTVRRPSQLLRDPHVLGWLEQLWMRPSRTGVPLSKGSRSAHLLRLRTLLDLLADLPQPPAPGLLRREDIPRRDHCLPRPLPPEQDTRLLQHWATVTAPLPTALHLMRLTGLRIGECVDLAPDCLRHLGDNHWTLHVPHGKPRSERWVPVDDAVRQLIERLCFLRTLPPAADPRYLLARPNGRSSLLSALRQQLRQDARQAGIETRLVPHQLRHTYATTMLRAGVSLPALMKLLGHHNANMTLIYVEVTQQDLQREFHAARQHPRHLAPLPPALQPATATLSSAEPACVRTALDHALRLLDLYRQLLPAGPSHKPLLLLSRRLVRIRGLFDKITENSG
jgi:site-specific recombinase XerD